MDPDPAASFRAASSDRRDGCHVGFGPDEDSEVELGAEPNRMLVYAQRESEIEAATSLEKNPTKSNS